MTVRDLKDGGFLTSEDLARAVLERDREAEKSMPWVARIALGIGAWLSGIFFTVFVVLLFDLNDELPMLVIGLVIATGSVFLIRQQKGIFLEQLALALGFAGHVLFFFGLHEIHRNDLVGPFVGALILCGPVYWFSKNRVQRFLSVLWVWLLGWSATMDGWSNSPYLMPHLVFFGALAVALANLSGWDRASGERWRPAMWASVAGMFGMLFWQSYGAEWGDGGGQLGSALGLGAAMGISAVLWHLARPEGKTVAGFAALFALLIAMGIAGAPGVVVGLGLMAIAHARSDRHLGWVAIVGLGHFLIAFYYQLDISLLQKSIILMVSGAVFLGMRFWLFRSGDRSEATAVAKENGPPEKRGRPFSTVVIIANCILVLAVVNGAIGRKQGVIDTGRTLYLELAPVDPRSLMQGDYMALAYALPRGAEFHQSMENAPTRGEIVVKLDENNVATFARSSEEEAGLGDDENLLKYRKWRRGFRFGIESFFFQEGLADVYDAAKFAELRVSSDGEAVLVDLRGEKRERLTSDVQPDEVP